MSVWTFTIPEANVSVFPTDVDGQPITDAPLWLGACAKGLELFCKLEAVRDKPSGVPYAVTRHVDEENTIRIASLWTADVTPSTPPADITLTLANLEIGIPFTVNNGVEYRMRRNAEYVVLIVWQDEADPTRWCYRYYYGVKDSSHRIAGSEVDGEIAQDIEWTAQYYLP